MEEADKLCEKLFLSLEKQEQCAKKLLALAEELENLHLGSNIVQAAGNVAAMGGFAVSGFATLTTIFTGGLAAPLTVPLVVAGIGAAVSLTPKAIESGVSHLTIKEATKCIEEIEEIQHTIQTLLEKLSAKCASQGQGASAVSSDQFEVITQIMGALARRHSVDVPLNFLRRFNNNSHYNQGRLVRPDLVALITGGTLLFVLNIGLNIVRKLLAKTGLIFLKLGIKGTAKVAGCFAAAALAAWDFNENINEIIDKRTEASRSLRDTARNMKKNAEDLRRKIEAQLEIIKKLSEFHSLLKDLGGYSLTMTEYGQNFLNFIKATCNDNNIHSWVDENQTQFLNLFRFLRDHLLKPLEEEKLNRRLAHIVFVAHGSITDNLMPTSVLVPTPSIKDTIIYSPWNCKLSAHAAAGIAAGCIRSHLKEFFNEKSKATVNYDRVPQRWNSMRESTNKVPQIVLGPVTPDEPAWRAFKKLGGSMYRDDRIIIPYLQEDPEAPPIPFYMLIFGASYILEITRVTVTVHLAACLGRGENRPVWDEWAAQYAYTEDGTKMTADIEALGMDPLLLRAFRMMFDCQ